MPPKKFQVSLVTHDMMGTVHLELFLFDFPVPSVERFRNILTFRNFVVRLRCLLFTLILVQLHYWNRCERTTIFRNEKPDE